MALGIPATRKSLERFATSVHMHCSDNAIYDFSKKAVENGLDIFRVFDSLNYFGACLVLRVGRPLTQYNFHRECKTEH